MAKENTIRLKKIIRLAWCNYFKLSFVYKKRVPFMTRFFDNVTYIWQISCILCQN